MDNNTIILLLSFVVSMIGIITPIIKLNTSITKLNVTMESLNETVIKNEKRNDEQDEKINNHEIRIHDLERK